MFMGSSCQKTQSNNTEISKRRKILDQQFQERLKFYATEHHPQHGIIHIYQSKQNFIAKINYKFISKIQLQRKASIFQIFTRQIKHTSTIYRMQLNKEISCNHNYNLTVYMSHHTYTLKEYLNRNKKRNTLLDNGQVWYILKAVTQVGALLESKKMFLRKLDSGSIWISPTYHIKISLDSIEYEGGQTPVTPQQCLLLAPEQMQAIYRQRSKTTSAFTSTPFKQSIQNSIKIDILKSRVFSLGMLIIECYTNLDSAINYYNYSMGIIDAATLNKQIKQISDQHLASLLSRMLQINPAKRIDFLSLNQLIQLCQNYQPIRDSLNIN